MFSYRSYAEHPPADCELKNQAKPLLKGEVLWLPVTSLLCAMSPLSETVHHWFFQTLMFLEYGNTDCDVNRIITFPMAHVRR